MTNLHKCTYVVTTDNNKAPGFNVDNNILAGLEIYYVELTDPTYLSAGYTFAYFPDPSNVIYYRNYD